MAARAGITRTAVIDTAVAMLDAGASADDVRLGEVARRLGIRTQSLYAHVDGTAGLNRALALVGLETIADRVGAAATGRSGRDAVSAIARAHLDLARTRTGLYLAAIHPPGDDPVLLAAVSAVNRPLEVVLDSLGLAATDQVHWTRLLLATVTGFVHLHRNGLLTLAVPPDDTVDRLVSMLVSQLPDPLDTPAPNRPASAVASQPTRP